MEWETAYNVSRSLTLQVGPDGSLHGVTSLSRRPQRLAKEGLPVLLAFASGATPRTALSQLAEEWEVEEEAFSALVDGLLEQGFLVPKDAASPALAEGGFAQLGVHQAMLRDAVRVFAYRSAIQRQCPGKRVLEIGCGTGILSLFAAQAGAAKLTAIEESQIAEVAEKMFAANGFAVDLKLGNSRDVQLDEPAEVIIHELLGNDPFHEAMLPVLTDARRFLAPGGRFLPYRLEVACCGLDLGDDSSRSRVIAEARELGALYGLDFGPYSEALAEKPLFNTQQRNSSFLPAVGGFRYPVLTEQLTLCDLDLGRDDLLSPALGQDLRLTAKAPGTLSGVVVFFRAHLDEWTQLTNSPFGPPTHWGWDVRPLQKEVPVKPGDAIPVRAELRQWLDRQALAVELV